ncbi:CHC2 zinc finger domain-containing protein [Lachnospiraceae bacterium 47-T17]
MKVNRDRFKKVIDAIEADAESSASSKYSFDRFCREHSLYSDVDKKRVNEIMICCPFHGDNNPSLSINENKRIWNCLGCNRGGSYLNFVLEYDNTVLGNNLTIYDEANKILRDSASLRAALGFDSIFTNEINIENFERLEYTHFKYKMPKITTYLELATCMLKNKCTADQIKYAILSMQSDIPISTICQTVLNTTENGAGYTDNKQKQYDLTEMLKE